MCFKIKLRQKLENKKNKKNEDRAKVIFLRSVIYLETDFLCCCYYSFLIKMK